MFFLPFSKPTKQQIKTIENGKNSENKLEERGKKLSILSLLHDL